MLIRSRDQQDFSTLEKATRSNHILLFEVARDLFFYLKSLLSSRHTITRRFISLIVTIFRIIARLIVHFFCNFFRLIVFFSTWWEIEEITLAIADSICRWRATQTILKSCDVIHKQREIQHLIVNNIVCSKDIKDQQMNSFLLFKKSFFQLKVKSNLRSFDEHVIDTIFVSIDRTKRWIDRAISIDELNINVDHLIIRIWCLFDCRHWEIVRVQNLSNKLKSLTFLTSHVLILWYVKWHIDRVSKRRKDCNKSWSSCNTRWWWWHFEWEREDNSFWVSSFLRFSTLVECTRWEQSHDFFLRAEHIDRIFYKERAWLNKWIVFRINVVNYQENKDTKDKSRQQCHQASKYKLTI